MKEEKKRRTNRKMNREQNLKMKTLKETVGMTRSLFSFQTIAESSQVLSKRLVRRETQMGMIKLIER